MDESAKRQRIEALDRISHERGIPCTIQRRIILEAVLDRNDHPTADQVYRSLNEQNREISRATVHRTLDFLAHLGVITKACHPGKSTRYDANIDIHHHLVCLHCDRMMDIRDGRLDKLRIPDTSQFGFEVSDFRVQIRGICRECRENQRRGESR